MEKAKLFGLGIAMSLIFLSLQPVWGEPPQNPTAGENLRLACGGGGSGGGQSSMGMPNYEPPRVVVREVVKEKETGEEAGRQPARDDQSLLVSTTKLVGNIVLFPFKLVSTVLGLIF